MNKEILKKGEYRYCSRRDPQNSEIPFGIELIAKGHSSAVYPIADICNFPPSTLAHTELQEAHAQFIVDAFNTHSSSGYIPSELAERLNYVVGMFNDTIKQLESYRDSSLRGSLKYELDGIINSMKHNIETTDTK